MVGESVDRLLADGLVGTRFQKPAQKREGFIARRISHAGMLRQGFAIVSGGGKDGA